MGSDEAKIEKKKQKAQMKIEKARSKANLPQSDSEERRNTDFPSSNTQNTYSWHKDPNWIRAIIAIVTLIVMIVTLYFTL